MKILIISVSICCIIITMQMIGCSIPSDADPVVWKMRVEIPVDNNRYTARELFPINLQEGMWLDFGKTDTPGDTVMLIKTDSLFYTIDRPLISTDTGKIEKRIGARTLKNTPKIDFLFSFLNKELIPYQNIPLSKTFAIEKSQNKVVNGIKQVTFDESSPDFEVTIQNTSKSVALRNVRITLMDNYGTIGWFDTSIISAASSFVIQMPVRNKTVHDSIAIALKAEILKGSSLSLNDELRISFSFDNLVVSRAVIVDSMIEYSDTLNGTLTLAESIRMDAIDIENASLLYNITNPCAFKLHLSSFIEDTWKRDYSILNNLNSKKNLSVPLDSSMYAGLAISDTLFKSSLENKYSKTVNLANIRLFPSWNSDSGASMLKYRYVTNMLPDGRIIRLDKNDIISFVLSPIKVPFIQIRGTITEKMGEIFSSQQKVGYDWGKPIIDSLKYNLRFNAVRMLFDFSPDLPTGSRIDSMEINVTMSNPDTVNQSRSLNEKLINVFPDSVYSTGMDITGLINSWPDSLSFSGELGLPSGTGIVLCNPKDENNENYNTNFTVGVNVLWKLKIPLSWTVLDTIRTEMEQTDFAINSEAINWTNTLEQLRVKLKLSILNNTDLAFTLFALGAEKKYKDELMAFTWTTSKFTRLELDSKSNLVLFSGADGIKLNPRNTYSNLSLELDKNGVETLLSEDGCYIRWFLLIPASTTNVFSDTDYLELKAGAVIEGVANSDSLFNL